MLVCVSRLLWKKRFFDLLEKFSFFLLFAQLWSCSVFFINVACILHAIFLVVQNSLRCLGRNICFSRLKFSRDEVVYEHLNLGGRKFETTDEDLLRFNQCDPFTGIASLYNLYGRRFFSS